MSDPFPNSPKSQYMRNRGRILNNMMGGNNRSKFRCRVCQSQPVLEVRYGPKGTTGWCKSCNQEHLIESQNTIETMRQKYQARFGNITGSRSIIVSKKTKRKPSPLGGELSEEDKKDLALLGSSDGARLVDSRESTYDG